MVLKFLLARGDATGRDIAEQVKLPFVPIDELLSEMKYQQLVVHRGSAPMNDFQYQLQRPGPRARAALLAALHLLRRGARLAERLRRQRSRPIA
jgi:hypothetical protein